MADDDLLKLRLEHGELRKSLREIELYTLGLLRAFENGNAEKRWRLDRMKGVIEEIRWRARWPRPRSPQL